ncbi:MAG: FtsX-like permease family protein, partial [Gemmatimonadales bacterium]
LGRLAPGVTVAQANAEVGRIISDVKTAWRGSTGGTSGRATIWQDDQTAAARPSVLMLSGAVLLLLLIACVNVATLMLGEAVRRQPEIFARRALGATPGRLGRQLITESVAIAGSAAILGALAARVGVRLLVRAAPAGIPGIADARVDGRVLAFTTVCALVIGVGFGLIPAFALLRRGAHSNVRIGTGQTQRGAAAIQRTLVAAEVALSIVMLVGCSLLGRSLVRLSAVNPGFVADGLFEIDDYSTGQFWRDDARVTRFYTAAVDALRGVPGVTAASGSSNGLFEGGGSSSPVKVEGVTYADNAEPPNIQQRVVLPGYLRTIGVPLIAGRDFNAGDQSGGEPSVILTQSAVKRDWGGRSPIGRHVIWQNKTFTVVGVAADIRYNQLSQEVQPMMYIPAAQWPGNTMVLTIRASADPGALESLVKARLAPLDPAVTVRHVTPLRTLIRHSYAEERYRTLLGSLFGILAAVLAGVGVFGVISRTVAQRIREAGIRVALGAQERSVIMLMLRDTLRGTAIGLAVGLVLAIALARALTPYLFGVTASDPLAYLLALGLLATTLVVATLPPARRAARVDPAKVLRTD